MNVTDITAATPLERSIGHEILAEARRIPMSHKEIQEAAGINDKSFRRWFVKGERHIPFDELEKVAHVVGLSLATLMQRAEDNLELLWRDENSKAAQHRGSVDKGDE